MTILALRYETFSLNLYINFMKYPILIALVLLFLAVDSKLIFSDEFDTFDFKKWKHDITLSGGGNWEFELY